jgi:hypothetical protein
MRAGFLIINMDLGRPIAILGPHQSFVKAPNCYSARGSDADRHGAGKLAMVLPNRARVRRRRPIELEGKSQKIDRLPQSGSRARGSRVGDELVAAFEEMTKHLRGEIELEAHDLPSGAMTPAQIKA